MLHQGMRRRTRCALACELRSACIRGCCLGTDYFALGPVSSPCGDRAGTAPSVWPVCHHDELDDGIRARPCQLTLRDSAGAAPSASLRAERLSEHNYLEQQRRATVILNSRLAALLCYSYAFGIVKSYHNGCVRVIEPQDQYRDTD